MGKRRELRGKQRGACGGLSHHHLLIVGSAHGLFANGLAGGATFILNTDTGWNNLMLGYERAAPPPQSPTYIVIYERLIRWVIQFSIVLHYFQFRF